MVWRHECDDSLHDMQYSRPRWRAGWRCRHSRCSARVVDGGGGYAGESSADAERPAQEEAATEIDEIMVTGQRDYLYRADQSDALGTSIPLAELPATVNVITQDFLEDTRAYDIEDV